MRTISFVFALKMILLFTSYCPAQQDSAGGKDHPMFNRLTGFYITQYEQEKFG
jgi:hypothetical protein